MKVKLAKLNNEKIGSLAVETEKPWDSIDSDVLTLIESPGRINLIEALRPMEWQLNTEVCLVLLLSCYEFITVKINRIYYYATT